MLNNILDRADLLQLRNTLLNDQSRIDRERSKPAAAVINDFTQYKGSYIGGLSYPLRLNNKGGLSLSYNDDRIREQIIEVLETRIGERIYRKFFGMPDVLFDSISEDILANSVRKQLEASIPDIVALEYDINIRSTENGDMIIIVSYNLEGSSDRSTLYYSVSV
jgi:phage baseplate assembly protein W